MDLPATQAFDDEEFPSTQPLTVNETNQKELVILLKNVINKCLTNSFF